MMGFLTSLLEEFWTGKGTLQQIGLSTPSQPITVLLVVLAGGATLFGTVNTLVKAQTGKLEPRCRSYLFCSQRCMVPDVSARTCPSQDRADHFQGSFVPLVSTRSPTPCCLSIQSAVVTL